MLSKNPNWRNGPNLSIIVPIYNNIKYTKHIYNQIQALDPERYHYDVIIFDDGSTDGTQDLRPSFPHRFISNTENHWVTNARNCSIDLAKWRFILVLNNDIVISETVVEQMLDLMKDKDCFVANAKIMMPGGLIRDNNNIDNISWPCRMVRKEDWMKIWPIPTQLKMFGNDDFIYLKVTQTLEKKSLWTSYPIYHFTSQTVRDYPTLPEVTKNDILEIKKLCIDYNRTHPKLDEMIQDMKERWVLE